MKRQLMLAVCLTVVVVALLLLMGGEGLVCSYTGWYLLPSALLGGAQGDTVLSRWASGVRSLRVVVRGITPHVS